MCNGKKIFSKTSSVITLLVFNFFNLLAQQNLVLNYSFEDTITCPPTTGGIYLAKHWFQPNLTNGTQQNSSSTDYFHTCHISSSWVSVPVNYFGNQNPNTWSAYAGCYLYSAPFNLREYVEGTLSSPLIAGREYCAEFHVSLADTSGYAISNIGMHFSTDSLLDTNFLVPLINYTPQVQNTSNNYITDKTNWVLISGQFTAQGGERFITIGNFDNNANTQKIFLGGADFAYYYIDDVSVICCDSINSCELPPVEPNLLIPTYVKKDEYFFITGLPTNSNLIIYNAIGQIVFKENNYQNKFSSIQIKTGIYFYQLQTPTGEIYNGKVYFEN